MQYFYRGITAGILYISVNFLYNHTIMIGRELMEFLYFLEKKKK